MLGFEETYRNKKVLVTGHTGFKGSWLSIWLNELGADVVGVALDPYTERDNFVVTGLKDRITDLRVDIREYDKLLKVFNEHQPEFVFHLAAQPLVRLSYEDPIGTYETNVMGTVNVLECIRKTDSVKSAVVITTDKCYENLEKDYAYKETDAMGGYDPYSSSKGCAELVCSAYSRSFFQTEDRTVGFATARAGNVIGGGDWAKDRLITDCIKAFRINEPIDLRYPDAVRPWQHVFEPLSGYLLLASKLLEDPQSYSGAWNFGPEQNEIFTVKEVIEKIIKFWGWGEWVDVSKEKTLHEAGLLMLDITKAKEKLGWKPRLTIDDALELTVKWYKGENADYAFDVDQINEYISK